MSDIRLSASASLGTLNRWIQTISGNLTGAQIYGYKGTRLSFGDALVTSIRDGAGSGALGGLNAIQVPSGSISIGASSTDFRQGAIVSTGNDHHLAIDGNGWFAVTNPAGAITYTRNGEFHVDDAGNLVDATGNFVLGVFNETKHLVLNDGKSFVESGTTPVLTTANGTLNHVAVGHTNLAGIVPVSHDVFGHSMAAHSIDTILGNGVGATSPDGTPFEVASVRLPTDVTTDAQGNLYFATTTGGGASGGQVRMVPQKDGVYFGIPMLANRVYTVAGRNNSAWAGDGAPATATGFDEVRRFSLDASGNLILTSSNRVVFVPQADGTYFGQTMQGSRAYTLADTTTIPPGATFVEAAFDPHGHAFFATSGAVTPVQIPTNVFMVPNTSDTHFGQAMTAGSVHVIAGPAAGNGYGPNGVPATNSLIRQPDGLTFDADGNLFFTDNWRVRMVPRQSGVYFGQTMQANHVYSIIGASGVYPPSDAQPALSAGISDIKSISLDPAGNIYFISGSNPPSTGSNVYLVPRHAGTYYGRDMNANWIYRIAGTTANAYSGDGGQATAAELNFTGYNGLHANGLGIWITDRANHRIRFIAAFDTADLAGDGLYTFLDQQTTGAQDRALATRYVAAGQLNVGLARTGTDLPLMTLRSVDGLDTPITITLSDTNNRPDNSAYDNARLIADAINAKANLTGVGVSIVRDRKDPDGKVALVMGHINRTLAEDFIDFTDSQNPAADLARTGAGLLKTITDSQGNVFHTINVKTLTASAPGYRPESGDKITFDATGQMINLSRGAEPSSAPPFATGVHVALIKPANASGLEKTAGSSRFTYTDAAGRLMVGYAGQTKTSQIDYRLGIQIVGSSTIGAENRLMPQALEAANTSITDQLPELTIAQKVFTSTSKLVSVGNSLVDDLNGLIR